MKGITQFDTAILGCDHAGFEFKEKIREYFSHKQFRIEDVEKEYNDPIPYIRSAFKVCREVLQSEGEALGILVCGTGVGISIAANRVQGINAGLIYDEFSAEYARKHNNANVLVFGSRTMEIDEVKKRIDVFLEHEFAGGKYAERNELLKETGSSPEVIDQILKD